MIVKESENRIRISFQKKDFAPSNASGVADILKVYRGEPGMPGRGIEEIDQPNPGFIELTMTDGKKKRFQLPKGVDGKSIVGKRGPKGVVGKAGKPGRGIESITQPTADTMKISLTDGTTVTLELPRGEDGRTPELRATATHLQWRYVGEKEWKNLLALSLLTGVSEGAGSFKIVSSINGTTGKITFSAGPNISITQTGNDFEISASGGGGGGDVTGPASATDNAIARYNGATGKIIQNSGASIDDAGNISATNFSGSSSGTNTGDEDLTPYALIASLATVATSGDHGDLTGLGDDDHTQYHNDSRALTWLGTRSTSDLPEGSNLYYTDVKVDARITLQKGAALGLATLDASSKIPTSQLPAIALTDVFVVNSQAAQLALSAEEGDVAVRTDENKSYIHNGGTSGTMADWQELLTPTDAVLSVNGFTGAVSLTTTNIPEGTNLYFNDERAQDAVGAMVTDGSLVYVDGTPLLTRGALAGDVTAPQGSNTTTIANDAVTFAKMQNISTQHLIGRSTAGTGDPQELSLGGGIIISLGAVSRSALTGDVTAAQGSNTTAIAAGVIVDADVNASAGIATTKLAAMTADRAVISNGSGFITPSAVTATELGYVGGVTSALQTQLNAKQPLSTPGYSSSRYYCSYTAGDLRNATVTLAANVVIFVLHKIISAITLDKLSCQVTTAAVGATNLARLGWYSCVNGHPGTLLIDAGTVSTASTGIKEITGLATVLQPGWYYAAIHPSDIVTVKGYGNTTVGGDNYSVIGTVTFCGQSPAIFQIQAYGSGLPASATGSEALSTGNPDVSFRL